MEELLSRGCRGAEAHMAQDKHTIGGSIAGGGIRSNTFRASARWLARRYLHRTKFVRRVSVVSVNTPDLSASTCAARRGRQGTGPWAMVGGGGGGGGDGKERSEEGGCVRGRGEDEVEMTIHLNPRQTKLRCHSHRRRHAAQLVSEL